MRVLRQISEWRFVMFVWFVVNYLKIDFRGLTGCGVDFSISKHFLPYFELTAKTDGWIAGNEFIEKNLSIQFGLSARF